MAIPLRVDTAGLAAGAQSSESAATESEAMPSFTISGGEQASVLAATEYMDVLRVKTAENAGRILDQANALKAAGYAYRDTDETGARAITESERKIPGS